FGFVLGHPQYTAHVHLAALRGGVRDCEPHMALDGGPGGFVVFDRLVAEARDYLRPGGYLIVEIGAPQEHHARKRLASLSGYQLADTIHDYSGHPRVLQARWQPSAESARRGGGGGGGGAPPLPRHRRLGPPPPPPPRPCPAL